MLFSSRDLSRNACFPHVTAVCAFIMLFILSAGTNAFAATLFDAGGESHWWFDPDNWSKGDEEGGPFLPPMQASGVTDVQINEGLLLDGEGVVYDPENDPFFPMADDYTYATGSSIAGIIGSDYGPQHLYRMYIGRNTTNTNLLTIKSGDLAIEQATIIGRSGSTEEAQNLGQVTQLGGRVRLPIENLDIGQREDSGWGNGVWDYHGGILEVALDGDVGIRLSAGGGAGTGGHGRFIMRNGDTPGYVRTYDFVVAAHGGDGDGVLTGVGIAEFHSDSGGTRPIQVLRNLTLNNGLDGDGVGIRSARLDLVLDDAPEVDGMGVPINLGLFDVDFDGDFVGAINGSGDLGNIFSNADGSDTYEQGDTVSALFGGTRYDWTISYTGTITWADPDMGIVQSVEDNGFDTDVVLIGLGSEVVGPVGLAGDYNEDGVVNAADYVVWRNADTNDVLPNEGASPGITDQADYDFWVSQFGNTQGLGSATSAVPEPASGVLLLVWLVGSVLGVRRRT